MIELILVNLILVIGACLQGLLGFGLGFFSAPLLFLLAPQYVPGPMILNALLLTLLMSIRNHNALEWRQTSYALTGGSIGVLAAALLMSSLAVAQYRMLFGTLMIAAVFLSLIGSRPNLSPRNNLIAGMLSGFMGTTTSAGGAPMGLLYQHATPQLRNAHLSLFFLYINIFGIVVLWISGMSSWGDILLFVQSIPALLLGWRLSAVVGRRINGRHLRLLILLVAFVAGLMSFIQ
ncbi:MAG: sulfite exporter TauE/SafE family protein [Gammaproteobacteria bacterium]|nr:sulfite exporter TauE/SafE family protein [Gammaproteobacteria bacterium]